jgi:hypothetical protein
MERGENAPDFFLSGILTCPAWLWMAHFGGIGTETDP